MIKGINHQIIEITDTDNIYYEKDYLVVRPEYKNTQEALLNKHARHFIAGMKAPSAIKRSTMFFYWFIRFSIFASIGAVVALLINSLL